MNYKSRKLVVVVLFVVLLAFVFVSTAISFVKAILPFLAVLALVGFLGWAFTRKVIALPKK